MRSFLHRHPFGLSKTLLATGVKQRLCALANTPYNHKVLHSKLYPQSAFTLGCTLDMYKLLENNMKKLWLLTICLCGVAPSFAQTNVGVSIGITQPGVYGRIDIGNFPQPRLIYPQPVVIVQQPIAVQRQPIYLYVPPGHQKNWGKYCGRYNACGQPVYFVREDWVRERYAERRDHEDHDGNGRGRGHGKDKKHKDKHKD